MSEYERRPPPGVGRYWLLGALLLVLVPILLRLPAWLAAACVGVIGWRAAKEYHGWELPPRWARVALTLVGLAGVLLAYRSLLGREPGVALLAVMLCLKLVELRTLRDAMVVVFLGYFVAVSGFLFSQSVFMGGYLFAVVLGLTTALVALNHPAGSVARSREYLRLAGALLLQGLPLMLLLFVLFPRISGPLWQLPHDAHSGRTGLSEDMTLGNIGNLADSPEVAFRVEFEGAVPAAERLYWRGPVLWRTDGRRWEQLPPYLARDTGGLGFAEVGDEVAYTLILEPHDRRWLFALDLPAEAPPQGEFRRGFQLFAAEPVKELTRYRLRSFTRYATGPLSPMTRSLALQLPGGANPQAQALGERWRAEGLAPEALVDRALALFRFGEFRYTRQPQGLFGVHPVDEFLFDTQEGFCEHYAAAFTTLMRAAGVPARVVTGYQGGEFNRIGNYLMVRQSDAHAWSEVWLPGSGWVRIDPTAVIPTERVEEVGDRQRFSATEPVLGEARWLGRAWSRLGQGWDMLNHGWNKWVLGFDQRRQRQLLRGLGLDGIGTLGWGVLLLGVLAAVLGLVTAFVLRQRARPLDAAAREYRRFCEKLARQGLRRAPGEGPSDFAERVAALRPDLAARVRLISGLYVRERYGRDGGRDLERLRRHVAEFKA